MGVRIIIEDVPERVLNALAERAAVRGKSLQKFLTDELTQLADRPSVDAWLERVHSRKHATGTRVSAEQILAHRDIDHR